MKSLEELEAKLLIYKHDLAMVIAKARNLSKRYKKIKAEIEALREEIEKK